MAFPSVLSVTETQVSTAASPLVFNLPATVDAGDLLILIVALSSQGISSGPSGWTELWSEGSDGQGSGAIYAKDAVGDEDGGTASVTPSTSSDTGAGQVYRISASSWGGTLGTDVDTSGDSSSSNSATPNSPSVTADWGSDDNLFLSAFAARDDDATVSAYPTNYSGNQTDTISGGGGNNGATVGTSTRNYASASDDPGDYTLSESERWRSCTLVIKPASGDININQTKQESVSQRYGGRVQTAPNWLGTWAKRGAIKIRPYQTTINHTHLTLFIKISASAGEDGDDWSWIFDEVGSNYKKIAITIGNTTTQMYVAVIRWDAGSETAWLVAGLSSHVIIGGATNYVWLYADNSQSDNTSYVGDPGDTVCQNICESDLKLFQCLHNNPADTPPEYKDMTSGNHDGSENGTLTRVVNANQGYVTDSDGTTGNFVSISDHADLDITSMLTVFVHMKREGGLGSWATLLGKMATGSRVIYLVFDTSNYIQLRINADSGAVNFYVVGATAITDTNWHTVGGTAKSGEGKCYRDGGQCGNTITTTYTALDTNNDAFNIFRNEQWSEEFTGEIGVVMVFKNSSDVKPAEWFSIMHKMLFDTFFKFEAMEEASQDVEINQVKKTVNVTDKSHSVAIDLLINQTKISTDATPKSHSIAIDEVVNQTKQSVQGSGKTHSLLIDEAISQSKQAIETAAKTHGIAIDVLINQIKQAIQGSPKSHLIAIDLLLSQTKQSIDVTPKSHIVAIDEIVNQVKQSIEVAAKTHAVLIDVAISQTKQSIDVTGKTHSPLIDEAITQTKQTVDVVPKSHTILIDVIAPQTKQSVDVSAKSHQVAIGITIVQAKQAIDVTPKSHSLLIDTAITQIKERIEADPKTHTIQVTEDVEIPQTKQSVDVTGKTHNILTDEAISQSKKSIDVTPKSHSLLIDTAITQAKQSVDVTGKTHYPLIDEAVSQNVKHVEITAKTHSLLIDEAITQLKQAIQADTKSHSVAIDLLINQIKQTAEVTPKSHVILIDEIFNQVAQSVDVTAKSHSVAIDEIIIQTAAAIAATAKSHRVAIDEIIYQALTPPMRCIGAECSKFTNWQLNGLSLDNSDEGTLYVKTQNRFGQYVDIYKDSGYAPPLIAAGVRSDAGTIILEEKNSSGLSGTVYWNGFISNGDIVLSHHKKIIADSKTHTIVTTADIEIQQVLQHIIATGKSHSILIVGGFIIIIGRGLRTMDRKVIFNFEYPQQILPVVELNQYATAHGEIELKIDDLEEITSIAKSIYSVNPPSSSNDNWQGVGDDLYDSAILNVTYTRLSSGKYKLHYIFDPSGIVGIGDGQFYGVLIKVNAADNATIPQAGIEFIMKINNNIATP